MQHLIATVEPIFRQYGLMDMLLTEYHARLLRCGKCEKTREHRNHRVEISSSDDDDSIGIFCSSDVFVDYSEIWSEAEIYFQQNHYQDNSVLVMCIFDIDVEREVEEASNRIHVLYLLHFMPQFFIPNHLFIAKNL